MTPSTEAASITQTTMSAVVHNSYGSSEVLHLAEIDTPTIAADEVLVHVRAAGLNRGTWHLMTGQPYLMRLMGSDCGDRSSRSRARRSRGWSRRSGPA